MGKVVDGDGGGERADAPEALRAAVRLLGRDKGAELLQPQTCREDVVHAAARDVEVRMRRCDGDAMREERGEPPSEREVGAQLLHAAKDRGVMRDDHVRAAFDRLGNDDVIHVERDEDALHLL